jgi:sporulation protein YlmC with PRC-barrel domain
MKAGYASLCLTLFIAGCSACAERGPTKTAHVLDGRQKIASVKKASPSDPAARQDQFRLSDFVNKSVRDRTGTEVARLDDLTIGAHGRVISATLTPASGHGAKVTIPFERLKVAQEPNGALFLETDVVLKSNASAVGAEPKEEAQSKTAPSSQNADDATPKEPADKPQ